MTENVTARLSVMMTPHEKAQLENKAKKAGVTVSELVRKAVKNFDAEPTEILDKLAQLEGRLAIVEARKPTAAPVRHDVHA